MYTHTLWYIHTYFRPRDGTRCQWCILKTICIKSLIHRMYSAVHLEEDKAKVAQSWFFCLVTVHSLVHFLFANGNSTSRIRRGTVRGGRPAVTKSMHCDQSERPKVRNETGALSLPVVDGLSSARSLVDSPTREASRGDEMSDFCKTAHVSARPRVARVGTLVCSLSAHYCLRCLAQ